MVKRIFIVMGFVFSVAAAQVLAEAINVGPAITDLRDRVADLEENSCGVVEQGVWFPKKNLKLLATHYHEPVDPFYRWVSFSTAIFEGVECTLKVEYWAFEYEGQSYQSRYEYYYQEKEDGLYYIGYRSYSHNGESWVLTVENSYYSDATGELGYLYMPYPVIPGASWGQSYTSITNNDGQTSVSYNVSSKSYGVVEDVVVPAGFYSGCIQLVSNSGSSQSMDWICPNVGIVKHTHSSYRLELVEENPSVWP